MQLAKQILIWRKNGIGKTTSILMLRWLGDEGFRRAHPKIEARAPKELDTSMRQVSDILSSTRWESQQNSGNIGGKLWLQMRKATQLILNTDMTSLRKTKRLKNELISWYDQKCKKAGNRFLMAVRAAKAAKAAKVAMDETEAQALAAMKQMPANSLKRIRPQWTSIDDITRSGLPRNQQYFECGWFSRISGNFKVILKTEESQQYIIIRQAV